MPVWETAATAAGCLFLVASAARLVHRRRPGRAIEVVAASAREAGLVLGLFTLWQIVRILAVTRVDGGLAHGLWIWRVEQDLRLPSELSLERFMLGHHTLMRWSNIFYAYVHFPAMNAFLGWLFVRHRHRYPAVRNTLVLATGSCLLIQMFVPVAPPRMLTSVGFVDEALLYGQSVYGAFGSGIAAQLSAMPSVHVAWAFLIAIEVVRISPSRWRWLIVAHPVLTTFVVAATANHFWADGIVAVVLLLLAGAVRGAVARGLSRLRGPASRPRRPGAVPDQGVAQDQGVVLAGPARRLSAGAATAHPPSRAPDPAPPIRRGND
jgi:PAP2 superfamily